MDRLVQRNVLAMSGRAVEAAGDIDVLLLDKTGTITYGNRLAAEFIPVGGHTEAEVTEAALRSSLADDTPEGKSIVALAEERGFSPDRRLLDLAEFVPFTAETRMSGIRLNGHSTMKGAVDAVLRQVANPPADLQAVSDRIAGEGGTPLAVMDNGEVLGVIYLKDTVKPDIRERFEEMRRIGIRTIMITGDNPLTAATIAREAGVDDFVAEAKPEDKIRIIRENQSGRAARRHDGRRHERRPRPRAGGCRRGDEHGHGGGEGGGEHGGPRLRPDQDSRHRRRRQATADDARRADDLQHRQRRGEVLRHPARRCSRSTYPELNQLNVMHLKTPQSAISSAIIFNAVIIVLLIPLALRGVTYRAEPGGEDAAAQPLDLRPRRHRRALRRHQTDRRDPDGPAST